MTIRSGPSLLVVGPSPSWPSKLPPHPNKNPAVEIARAWKPPPAIFFTCVQLGNFTMTGLSRLVVEPSPSWPRELFPQASTLPVVVSARLKPSPPALMALILTPVANLTLTGSDPLGGGPAPRPPPALPPHARPVPPR